MVKEIKDELSGNEDKCDVIVIPWKAAATSKYAAKELCGPIAYRAVEEPAAWPRIAKRRFAVWKNENADQAYKNVS